MANRRQNLKFRSDEKLDVVEKEVLKGYYSISEEDEDDKKKKKGKKGKKKNVVYTFTDEDFDEYEVQENQIVLPNRYYLFDTFDKRPVLMTNAEEDNDVIYGTTPDNAYCEVKTSEAGKVVLTNGRTINKVSHAKVGDFIKVYVPNEQFVEIVSPDEIEELKSKAEKGSQYESDSE
eukprot:TRINITY_DN214_c1_g1_i1.p1 TRINITY_DN214_c1_g1~~TRINITY_DN214_c1_g1_i1.p1  ORF type:complete len:176 (-),score=67.22 TRINITY_DN214_c1_g1_i1:367-894(-)